MNDLTLTPLNATELDDLKTMVSDVLAQAQKAGATEAECSTSLQTGLSTTVRLGDVETITFNRERSIGISVYFGQKKGTASTSDTRPEALRQAVEAACHIARYTSDDQCAGLADKNRLATEFFDLDLDHHWAVSPDDLIAKALACEQTALNLDERITNSEGASVSTGQGIGVYGNSHGFIAGNRGTRHSSSCVLIAGQAETMQRDYWYSAARSPQDLDDDAVIARRAVERTVARLGARKVATAKVPVLFAPEMATGLLSSFIGAISGGSLYRKASFLVDHLNKAIFSPFVHIHEQPHLAKAMGSCNYDGDGVATQARDIVKDGILQSYVLSSYSARKLGLETTANAGGVHNLTLTAGEKNQAELLKMMGTGLLVTELMGQGVNLVTGDYSRGAAGFWVEEGEIQYPVEEVTIAGNLKDIFMNIVASGNDVDCRGNIRAGSLLIEEMMLAG